MAFLLLLLAVYSAFFWWTRLRSVPPEEDWRAAAKAIDQTWQKHDFIAVVPVWANTYEAAFADLRFPYRYTQKVVEETWPVADRLWVVESYDRFTETSAAEDAGWTLLSEQSFGRLNVYLYQLPKGNRASWIATDHLREAEVSVITKDSETLSPTERKAKSKPCTWDEHPQRWQCPGVSWSRVQVEQKPLNMAVRKVIFAHPRADGTLWLDFPETTLQGELVLETGFSKYATSMKNGSSVLVSVYIGDELVQTVRTPNRNGWFRFIFPTETLRGQKRPIRFGIRTQVDAKRHFYLDAFIR